MSETCLSFPENSLVCRICLVAQEVREMSNQEINWLQNVANASSPSSTSEMCVCWVCGHLLRKYMRFLQQCQKAHHLLTLVAQGPIGLSISSNDKAHNFIHTKPTTDSLPPTVTDSYTNNVDVKMESVDAELDRIIPINGYNERADSHNDLLLNMNSDAELDSNIFVKDNDERADSDNNLLLNMNSDADLDSNIFDKDNDESTDSDNNLPLNMNGNVELDSSMLFSGNNERADFDNNLPLNMNGDVEAKSIIFDNCNDERADSGNDLPLNIIKNDIIVIIKDVDTGTVTNTQTGGLTDNPQSAFECKQSDTQEYRGIKHTGPEPEAEEEPVDETVAATQSKFANNSVPNILKRHQCLEAISKKSLKDYRCYTCNEEFPDWADLLKHLIQHVALPWVVVPKLPLLSGAEPAPPSDGDWCEGEDETFSPPPLPPAPNKPSQRIHTSQRKGQAVAGKRRLCAVCNAVFPDEIDVKKHVKRKHVPPIQCTECFTHYPDYSQFKQHVRDGCRRRFKCKFCNKSFGLFSSLECHKNVHTKNGVYQCDMCSKKFPCKGVLRRHITRSHLGHLPIKTPGRRTLCAVCNDVFPNMIDVKKHVKEKHVPPIQCTECFTHYLDYSQFTKHVRDGCHRRFNCKFCDKSFWTFASIQKHENNVHTKKNIHNKKIVFKYVYKCDKCQKKFPNESALEEHISVCHLSTPTEGKSTLHCAVCNAVFPEIIDVKKHVKETHVPPIQCTKCSTHYPDYSQFKKHVRDGCRRRFKCKSCDKSFNKFISLECHENSVHTTKTVYQCDMCQRKFLHKYTLRKHITHFHLGHLSIKTQAIARGRRLCAVCNAVFPDVIDFEKHVKEKHVPPIQCTECSTHYLDYSQFKQHVRDGCRRRFKCKFCDKSYGSSYAVRAHENRVHTKKDFYQCDICQKKYRNKSTLRLHIRKHLFLKTQAIARGRHLCAVCNAVFPDVIDFEKHVKEKHVPPIQCTECFTHYLDYSQFTKHVRDGCHRRFKCKFCDKSFGKFSNLHRHENAVHTKKIVYECDMCQRKFLHKYTLRKHITHFHLGHLSIKTQAIARGRHLCAVCNAVFPDVIDFEKHVKEKHVPPIQCTECSTHYPDYSQFKQHVRDGCRRRFKCKFYDKSYGSSYVVRAHENRVHTKKDFYQCDICQKKYRNKNTLRLHIRKHLFLKTQDKRNDYHGCAVCNAVFPKMFDVDIHVKEKHVPPIKCTKCSTHYPDYSQFKQHLRDGCLRRFKCKFCHKGFGKIDELQHHENSLHTKKNVYQCDTCQKNFPYKSCLRKHIIIHLRQSSIKTQGRSTPCAVCNDVFPGMDFVYKHVKEKHVPPIQCTECFTHYLDYSQFTKHVRDGCHRRFKCKFCDKSFGKFSNWHRHENAVHTKKIVYECDMCQKKFLYQEALIQHNSVYHPSTRTKGRRKVCQYCFVCNAKFMKIFDVEEHAKEKHVPPIQCTECSTHYPDYFQFKQHVRDGCRRRFKCKFCDKSYGSLPGVEAHENSQHTKKDFYQCNICQKEFLYKKSYAQHIKRHFLTDKRKFHCAVCNAKFSKIFDIEKHVRAKHVPPIQCTECFTNYPDYSQFKKHVRDSCHRPRRYNCKFCDKTFARSTGLQTHENIHTKKNVYSCDICNKQFLKKQNKQRHEDTVHTKKKVYPCGVCQKQFVNRDVHRVHTLTHQKPHLCDLCGKRFTLPEYLKLHKQRKHSK